MTGKAALWFVVFLVSTVQLIYMPAVGETHGTRKIRADEGVAPNSSDGENNATTLSFIKIPKGYDNKTRPSGPSLLDVDCSISVMKLGPFLEKEMLFPISYYFACSWTDTRLKVPTGHSYSYVDESAGSIWRPQPFPMPMTDTSAREEFVEPPLVISGGKVISIKKFSFDAPCRMKLHSYPHDQQFCNVPIMMRGGVKASWSPSQFWPVKDRPILMNMQAVRSVFRVDRVDYISWAGSTLEQKATCIYQKGSCDFAESEDCQTTSMRCSEAENWPNPTCIKCNSFGGKCSEDQPSDCSQVLRKVDELGTYWTTLDLRLKLTRRLGYHFLQTYIPSASVVGMSWVSFWIDPSSAPARTGLGVTTVLTMVTLSGKVGAAPELNYIRAIDVWMLTCKLFVILALLEYAFVNFADSTQKKKGEQTPDVDVEQQTGKDPGPDLYDCEENGKIKKKSMKEKFSVLTLTVEKLPRSVDHVSRVLFPVAFSVFVCAYFSSYLLTE
ncbi:glycine receptor subunit alphaZ1-like isoform X1 [Branchiostoma lanceolatum]|uniref:glycine receptor subunit alphaZ1-like isoform X1 n=2 Tax=Branchiostoma lanceolatum TaxID=7740 RepID=UPI0034532814